MERKTKIVNLPYYDGEDKVLSVEVKFISNRISRRFQEFYSRLSEIQDEDSNKRVKNKLATDLMNERDEIVIDILRRNGYKKIDKDFLLDNCANEDIFTFMYSALTKDAEEIEKKTEGLETE